MSNVTLQDTNFESEINFISLDKNTGESKYVPIDLASVSYFEIRDDLLNYGLTGNLTFPDWGQLLGKLGFGRDDKKFQSDEQYITIKLRDIDIPATKDGTEVNGYEFLASAKSSASLMSNVTDVKKTVDFEENLTATLKKISWEIFINDSQTSIEPSRVGIRLLENLLKVVTKNKSRLAKSLRERENLLPFNNNSSLTIFTGLEKEKAPSGNSISLYELIQNILNYILLRGERDDFKALSLPIIKTTDKTLFNVDAGSFGLPQMTEDGKERVLEVREMFTPKHLEFIEDYKTGKEVNYSDVYMEEFVIAPSESISKNSSLDNNVENYDLIQPDLNNLRQTVWGSYENVVADVNAQRLKIKEFNELANDFENRILNGQKSNLPSIPREETKLFKIISPTSGQNAITPGRGALDARVFNTVLKSFIYLNETIILNVKGKLYRKPGMFITVKSDMFKRNSVEEIWYVIEVKHKFINGNYQNEIKAVRFLADGEKVPRIIGNEADKLPIEKLTDQVNSLTKPSPEAWAAQRAAAVKENPELDDKLPKTYPY